MSDTCNLCIPCIEGSPFTNLSSEGPEIFLYRAYGYCCDGTLLIAESPISYQDAADEIARRLLTDCPDCANIKEFCADASCPSGSNLTTICVDTSQDDANALAAKKQADMQECCDNPDACFQSTCSCPDGTDAHTTFSSISQAVADAECAAIPKNCGTACNEAQTCAAQCASGTFNYTVPACTIYANTVAEANAQAMALACQRANAQMVCLGPIQPCCCEGDAYSSKILVTGTPTAWAVTSGTIPPGLTLYADGTISGNPITAGNYTFTVRATTAANTYAERTYTIYVVTIFTSTLPAFTAGVAYSYQLQAVGGSGSYLWQLVSGTLPPGLILEASGLLHGTPTGGGAGALGFEVIDQACEAANRSFYTPRVALSSVGHTKVKTRRGWGEFVYSTGALYKRVDWVGSASQVAYTAGVITSPHPNEFCGGSQWTYGGASEIDIYGNFISHHYKNLTVACNKTPYPTWNVGTNGGVFVGYCFQFDPASCSSCNSDPTTWLSAGNWATDSSSDDPLTINNPSGFTVTPLTRSYNSGQLLVARILNTGLPQVVLNGILAAWVEFSQTGNYTATLSNEYTDIDAEASALHYTNASRSAETLPNILTWTSNYIINIQSRYTTVDYTLNCTNLVGGQSYTATIDLWDSSGVITPVVFVFVATGTTQALTGTIPTPAAGHSITVKNARIAYT